MNFIVRRGDNHRGDVVPAAGRIRCCNETVARRCGRALFGENATYLVIRQHPGETVAAEQQAITGKEFKHFCFWQRFPVHADVPSQLVACRMLSDFAGCDFAAVEQHL